MAGILQNAFGNTAYVNQTNLDGKLRKKLGGGQAKIWEAMAHPIPPLESPLLLCKKAAPFYFFPGAPQLVLSALIGSFANKVACFSHLVSRPIAKSHVKPWSVREHDTT